VNSLMKTLLFLKGKKNAQKRNTAQGLRQAGADGTTPHTATTEPEKGKGGKEREEEKN